MGVTFWNRSLLINVGMFKNMQYLSSELQTCRDSIMPQNLKPMGEFNERSNLKVKTSRFIFGMNSSLHVMI